MKKILFCISALVLCVSFSLTSCSKIQEKKAREQFVRDSIDLAERRAKFVADSIENARKEELAQIAWGQTRFGMSLEEALNTETCEKSKKIEKGYGITIKHYGPDWIELVTEDIQNFNRVTGLKAGISTGSRKFLFSFKEDELKSVYMRSYDTGISSVYTNDLIYDMQVLTRQFTDKYGEPKSQYGKVESYNFKSGEEYEYARWQIKGKFITISFGRKDYKDYYEVFINNVDYPKKKHVDTPEEIAEKERKKKEADFVKSNSF